MSTLLISPFVAKLFSLLTIFLEESFSSFSFPLAFEDKVLLSFFILLRSDCFSLFVLSSFSMAPRRCLFKYSMSTCNEKIHQKLFNTPLQSTSMTQVKELTLLSFFEQLPNIILFHILVIITHGLKHKGENSEKGMKY